MRSRTKRLISMLCVAAMLVSALPVAALAAGEEAGDEVVDTVYTVGGDTQIKDIEAIGPLQAPVLKAAMPEARAASAIYKEGGWLESAYIEWTIGDGVTKYEVSVKEKSASTWTKLDDQLIRRYPGYMRADALGLKAGTYQMKVTPNTGAEMISGDLKVEAHDRSGYAFVGGTSSGAYNDDGTLKAGANVVYITQETASTVKLSVDVNGKGVKTEVTGLPGILLAYKKGKDKTPLCIRFVGIVAHDYTSGKTRLPSPWKDLTIKGVDHTGAEIDLNNSEFKGDIQLDGCTGGVTFEGVGIDAVIMGMGFRIKNSSNVEIRNLGIMNVNSGELDNIGFQPTCDHVWAHNNDIFYGMPGKDSDQVKGDGALDAKGVKNASFSYNHFWDVGKSNLCGLNDNMDYLTYHHNWYDHSDSRHPRIRYAKHVHVYNNYFDGNAKYGVGATTGSSTFVENNYFRNCNHPVLISMQGTDLAGGGTFSSEAGGMIKMFGNTIEGGQPVVAYSSSVPVEFDAYVAAARDEQVPATVKTKKGGTDYNNFDTASDFYKYTPDTPAAAKEKVMKYAGRVEGGDISFTFTNSVDDASYAINDALSTMLKTYESDLISVGGTISGSSSTEHTTHTYGPYEVETAATCTSNGVEVRTCLFPGCGATDSRVIPGGHKYVNGQCSVCHEDEPAGGGSSGPVSGGVGMGAPKVLKASSFKITTGKQADLTADEIAEVENGYFSVEGSSVYKRTKDDVTGTSPAEWIQLPNTGNGAIEFTVEEKNAPATLVVNFSSTSDKDKNQTASIALKTADGVAVKTDTQKEFTVTTGSNKSAINVSYSNLEAGTYKIVGTSDGTNSPRIYTVTVTETAPVCQHKWSAWTTTRPATCGEDGWRERTCSECNKVDGQAIEATGEHTWGNWVAADDGDETRTCSVCGETESKSGEQPTPPEPVAVTAVVLSRSAANLTVGGSVTVTATVSPSNAADKTVSWSSSNTAVATVSNGVVTAVSAGTATITATAGGKSATCAVTVKAAQGGTSTTTVHTFESKTLTKNTTAGADGTKAYAADNYFTLMPGGKAKYDESKKQWKADDFGENAYDPSGDDAKTNVVRFSMGGKTTAEGPAIKFTTTSDNAKVQIWWVQGGGDTEGKDDSGNKTGVFSDAGIRQIALLDSSATLVTKSELAHTSNTPSGTDAGRIKANDPEYTELIAPTAGTYLVGSLDGSNYIFKIVVTETTTSGEVDNTVYVDAVTVTPATATLNVGGTATLTATVTPADATNSDVTWTSSNTAVATVANGVVTAKAAGEAIITATADGVNGLCTVTVNGSGNTPTPPGPSGDDTPSGGGGGGGGSITTKPVEVTPGDDTFLTIDSATKDNVAVAELTDSQAKALTNNAVKNNSANIVVTVNGLNSVGTARLNVSAKALDNIADKTDAALTVQTPVGDVKLPAASVADLGGNSGKTITVMVAKTDDGVKVTVAAGNKILDKVAGGVTAITEADGSGSVAYLVAADGSEKLVKKSYVEAGKLHANLPGSGTIVLKDNAKTFRDTETSWAKDAIGFAASRELFNGVNELDFAPNQEMTRAMLVTVLYRLEGAVSKDKSSFKDVPADSWYSEAVAWGSAEGIVSGKMEGYFGPDDDITREQLATILYRYATKLCGMTEVSESSKALDKYPDAAVVSGYAEDGMKWAVQQGIIGGRGDGTLAPSGFASRAEVATMLMRFVKAIV